MREDDRDRVCRQGTQAWQRLKKEKSWGDWLKVGEALEVGRDWAMRQAGTNRPEGKGYNLAFSEWLTQWKLNDMDKGDRSRLFEVMDNLGPIEQWRGTLTLTEKLKLNHPNSVLRRWKKAIEPPRADDKPGKPTLRESVASLSEDNAVKDQRIAGLEAYVAELEAARRDGSDAWIAALEDKSTAEKATAVWEVALRLDLSISHIDEARENHKAALVKPFGPRQGRAKSGEE